MTDERSSYEMQKNDGITTEESTPSQQATETSNLVAKDEGVARFSRDQKCVLLGLVLVEMGGVMGLSMMAPFFPKQASLKGLTATTTGWIFGIFALTVFVMSPVFGKLLPYLGCRAMIFCGELLFAFSFIIFGCLKYVENEVTFAVLCFLFRVLMALGVSASSTASFAVVSQLFESRMSETLGILEASAGLAWTVGPALGGFLFMFGGFTFPFVFFGIAVLVLLPVYIRLIPGRSDENQPAVVDEDAKQSSGRCHNLRLFLNPTAVVMFMSVTVGAIVWSSLQPLLEPHLRPFQLSGASIAGIVSAAAALYGISCPIVGRITDRIRKELSLLLMSFGFLVASLSLLFMGPSPILTFLHEQNLLWLNILSLAVLATTGGFCIVPPYNKIVDSIRSKTDLSLSLHGAISGLYHSCFALGEFIGTSSCGWLYDGIGYGWTLTVVSACCFAMSVVIFLFCLWQFCRKT